MLKATNLQLWRGERHVLRGLSFEIGAGEALHVSGPNGVGKTSLLRVICGLLQAEEGEVSWQGVPTRAALETRIERGFDDPWVAAALASRPGQAYLWWARVPVAQRRHVGRNVEVTLRDLRYSRTLLPTAETWTPFSIRFRFDPATGELLDVHW